MKTTNPNWNMKKLSRMETAGELRFDYPIQRASGQWDELQQSLLIHSIVADMPIPPIAIAKAEVDGQEGEYVIDGKQRSTTVLNFMAGVKDEEGNYPANSYKLHADTPNVTIEGVGEVELAGKRFDELHADVISDIQSAKFMIQRMENATDEEIEEIFNRWNNGTPLTKQQKARGKMGTANATIIAGLLNHPFIQDVALFTPLQTKRSDDEAVILQTMMLMTKGESEFESFVADKILGFASEMREADITDVTKELKEALDYAYSAKIASPIFKKLHLPTILLVAKKAKDEKVAVEVFGAWVEDFNNAINGRTRDKALIKTNYKQYMGAGSVKKNNVLGRKNAMIKHFNEFVDCFEVPATPATPATPPVEEVVTEEPKKAVNTPKAPSKEQVEKELETLSKELESVLG